MRSAAAFGAYKSFICSSIFQYITRAVVTLACSMSGFTLEAYCSAHGIISDHGNLVAHQCSTTDRISRPVGPDKGDAALTGWYEPEDVVLFFELFVVVVFACVSALPRTGRNADPDSDVVLPTGGNCDGSMSDSSVGAVPDNGAT